MTDPAKKPEPGETQVFSVRDWRLEATTASFQHQVARASATPALQQVKPLRDLAFAVALRDSGVLTESQIASATRNWTAFGERKLSDHLLSNSHVRETQIVEAEKYADTIFESATKSAAPFGAFEMAPQDKVLSALNPDGRLGTILGLAGRSSNVGKEIEDRSVGARYTLLRQLGQGGLGTVWLARDENLNRYVAVKELTSEANAGDVALEHFRREAEITGRLEHPGIVPIYQFGRDDKSGKAFYAMRFLGRRTLQDAIDEYHERHEAGAEDKMLLHRLLSSFVSVCHSVEHAHAQKVVHRDLKPANVALDEFGQVTLLDWGLSKVDEETGMYDVAGRTEPGDLHDMSAAHQGRVIGTPLYMAPEQAAGRLEDVDALTDVFGLGGILYTILTGVGPHHASAEATDTGAGREQFLSRIVANDVVAPEERRANVPPELNAICMKALSRQRYHRYQSAAKLADDVQRYMAGTPVHAYDAPLKRKFSRWMMRHPTLAQMLLLSASLVVIALGAVALTARNGRERFFAARHASAVETAHDMEFNLQFEARALERDLHFITELPLMSAITQTHLLSDDETQPEVLQSDTLNFRLQSPEQWLDRQGELFDGFLDANPSYLMMVSCKSEGERKFRELVRSQRFSAGQRAMRVPNRQLKETDASSQSQDSDMLGLLRPGAALLVTNDQFSDAIPTNHRSPLVLSGVAGVYDSEGEFFGINIIELDLGQRLRELIPSIAPEYISVIVTDASGRSVMHYRDGRFIDVPAEQNVTAEFPGLQAVFDGTQEVSDVGGERGYYARLVELGPSSTLARVGIVTFVSE
ncbi:MAG: hypothetical protein Aurels2KO_27920 [Aureliella sp.]